MVYGANTVVFGTNTLVFGANTVVFWANDMLLLFYFGRGGGLIQTFSGPGGFICLML